MRPKHPCGCKLTAFCCQKCRGAAAAAAPKGAPRRRRRDLLRRVTLHLCSKAGALSYTIVQDGWQVVDAVRLRRQRFGRAAFGVTSEAAVIVATYLMAPSRPRVPLR